MHKSYGKGQAKTPVLRGVSLEIQKGEIVALIGQSGSGKSTLLNIIGSLDTWESGQVEVMGIDFSKARETELAAMRNEQIGFVFQSFNLLDHLTCIENVVLPASFTSMREKDAREQGMEALRRVGLEELAHRPPGELSGGQKQRVAIARALYNKPKLLLCDEPTGNLDSETGENVIEFFGELNREDGMTLLIVTHEERLSRFAERVVHIKDGVIQSDDASELHDVSKEDSGALAEENAS
ncbi:MAG: ABC transporter ATP-binding protein [Myxococcales bacterium]|nr:ABC transporter ATP-binding protein [Myxococcales bacterium]